MRQMLEKTKTPGAGAERRGRAAALERGRAPYDVRLKREITHRSLVISMFRRVMRLTTLHLVDGALIAAVALLLATFWSPFAALYEYIPAVVAIHLLSLNALSAYQAGDARRDERRLVLGVGLALMTLSALALFPPRLPLEPLLLAAFGTLTFSALLLGRYGVDQVVRIAYKHGIGLRRALLIGNLDEVGHAIGQLRDDRNIDHYIVGHVTPAGDPDPASLGSVTEIARVMEEQSVQEVIVSSLLPQDTLRQVAQCCFEGGAALFVIPPLPRAPEYRAEPLRVGGCALLRLHPGRLELPALLVKRGFDLVLASLALLLAAPLMLLIAAAIKLDSPGPVFFRAKRVGLGGELFDMWKFRSMCVDAAQREAELAHLNIYEGGTFKIRNDPRITRMGRFLRRTSLDELPQLFNVLAGEMSLVGPRPALVSDLDRYAPHHFERLAVIPGITGAWQVGGRNLITDFETVFDMDRSYIRSWSLLLDIKIMLRTVKVVAKGEGAY
jgi:exopolysaccharide biosynthesis polyprenyl glycosylphosphotransferase